MSFVYSSHLGLHAQLSVLLVFAIIGTISFCRVEWSFKKAASEAAAAAANNRNKTGDDKLRIEGQSD